MLSFVQSWFSDGANPVGVDFGTEWLRLAQVDRTDGDTRLIAAASAQVPSDIRKDHSARMDFLAKTLRHLWTAGNFRGRKAVLALPAASLHVQHLRFPKMDTESLRKAMQWETQGKLPIDSSTALIRHLVAGDVYHEQEPRTEVIVFATQRQFVDELLAAAGAARLDIVGMTVEPRAMIDCFSQVYRRKNDSESTNCFVDIGSESSRAVIARGGHIYFVRRIPVGGAHCGPDQATRLLEEIDLCRRYHETTFPNHPLQRLIFVGGGAREREVCEQIAKGLGIAAQLGDPLVRMGRTTQVGTDSGIDRRQPQPAWAVALGLSMGFVGSNVQ